MTTTPNTDTNTNTNANAPVVEVDDCDCGTGYATHAEICAPYITLEEARKERQEEERNEQLRAEWGDRLENAALRVHKRARVAEKEEMDDAVRAAAKRARNKSPLAIWFEPALARDVKQQTLLVIKCLDDERERAQQREWAPLAQHWKKCLPDSEGILVSSVMQPYLRRWAAADAAAAVEEAATIAP